MGLREGFVFGGVLTECVAEKFGPGLPIPKLALHSDEYWMCEALKESMKSIGLTSPNPAVGCVLVSHGRILSQGATEKYGDRHAERVAFEKITEPIKWEEVTAYVTLEPCSHQGKQPPCVDLFRGKKLKEIVIATQDTNPLVNGNGVDALKKMGHKVRLGILENEVKAWLSPFLISKRKGRPVIAAKWAESQDGYLADAQGNSKWISNEISRSYTHWLRQKYDVIAVGAQTVLKDFPRLTVRDCANPINVQPIKLIFDPKGRILQCDEKTFKKLLQTTFASDAKIIMMVEERNSKGSPEVHRHFHKNSNQLLMTYSGDAMEYFTSLLTSQILGGLHERPVQSLMVEGGAQLLAKLFENQIVDIVHRFVGKVHLGPSPYRAPKIFSSAPSQNVHFDEDVITEMDSLFT